MVKTFEANRSKARRLIAAAFSQARKASNLLGAERGTLRAAGAELVRQARVVYPQMPREMELRAMCALYPDDTRMVSRLANIRCAKFGYSVKSQW